MCNAIKTTRKELFKKEQVKKLERNGNLSRNCLVRPLAPESTKKFIRPGDFFNDFHSVPMTFPLKNRQIITSCIGGKMTYTEENNNWEGNVNIIKEIIKKHNGERGVIHTQSYKKAQKLYFSLKGFSTFLHDKKETNENIIKDITQMYGRAVRSPTDYAKFYIIDGSFRTLSKKGFPQYFLDALYNKKKEVKIS